MRHRKAVRKLNRTAEHRKAVLANLASALFERKQIKTTHVKAKATQQFAERLITIAKSGSVHARRLVLSRVRQRSIVQMLFKDIVPVYANRAGGYTRVIRLGQRPGDGAEVSILELVGFEEALKKRTKEKKEKEAAKAAKAEAVAAADAKEAKKETVAEEEKEEKQTDTADNDEAEPGKTP